MLVIPAIDIKGGKCVRLFQGDYAKETVYSDDPVDVAKKWEKYGAKRIHLVDLDGALEGVPRNLETVKNIRKAVKAEIEYGGGVRLLKTIDSLIEAGINYVILGTAAVKTPELLNEAVEKYGQKIIVGLDARKGKVAVSGWKETSGIDALELALKIKAAGIKQIIFTDIEKDGAMIGPNISALKEMAVKSGVNIIASGGISTENDVMKIKELESFGVNGMIIGKALYKGTINLIDIISKVPQGIV
jgi:phosphoribosylformimino-5-aminoimidazole carboxamide ribotide isomerase